MYPIDEIYVFLVCTYSGIIIGICFDFYRAFKISFGKHKVLSMIMDLFISMIIGIVSFFVIHKANAFDLRYYNFAGIIIGVSIYFFTISKYIFGTLMSVLKTLIRVYIALYYLIVYPIHAIFDIIFCKNCKRVNSKISKLEKK